jgi:hypothetical protein
MNKKLKRVLKIGALAAGVGAGKLSYDHLKDLHVKDAEDTAEKNFHDYKLKQWQDRLGDHNFKDETSDYQEIDDNKKEIGNGLLTDLALVPVGGAVAKGLDLANKAHTVSGIMTAGKGLAYSAPELVNAGSGGIFNKAVDKLIPDEIEEKVGQAFGRKSVDIQNKVAKVVSNLKGDKTSANTASELNKQSNDNHIDYLKKMNELESRNEAKKIEIARKTAGDNARNNFGVRDLVNSAKKKFGFNSNKDIPDETISKDDIDQGINHANLQNKSNPN